MKHEMILILLFTYIVITSCKREVSHTAPRTLTNPLIFFRHLFEPNFVTYLQEVFRYISYLVLRKTEAGLKEFSDNSEFAMNRPEMAYVSGLGFGAMSGAFALVNVLADSVSTK